MTYMKNYLMIIMIAATALTISGCYTDKQAYQELIRANQKYPQKVAEFARTYYPCFDVRDTTVVHDTSYDFIEIQCPEEQLSKIDTIWADKWRVKKVYGDKPMKFVSVPTVTKIINSYIRDSAEVSLLEYRLKSCNETNVSLYQKNDAKASWIKWLIIILAVSLIGNIIQLQKK